MSFDRHMIVCTHFSHHFHKTIGVFTFVFLFTNSFTTTWYYTSTKNIFNSATKRGPPKTTAKKEGKLKVSVGIDEPSTSGKEGIIPCSFFFYIWFFIWSFQGVSVPSLQHHHLQIKAFIAAMRGYIQGRGKTNKMIIHPPWCMVEI